MHTRTAPPHTATGRPVFRLIAFDWDGTAVTDRKAPADDLVPRVESLHQHDVVCAVITGTNIGNLQPTFFDRVAPVHRRGLLACTNRGSEVFAFDGAGNCDVLYRRQATAAEDAAMDEVALEVQAHLREEHGLQTHIVFDRLNRRKIDLIPVPEWEDPPKERIGALLEAVDARLSRCGVQGGIRAIMDQVEKRAASHGVALRLTTDVKHVELGLTDKSDSVAYLLDHVAAPRGIDKREICFLGDEFGPIAGFPGSDYRMSGVKDAAYYSVGKEPNGVPEGVEHLGGGVPCFLSFLDDQVAAREEMDAP